MVIARSTLEFKDLNIGPPRDLDAWTAALASVLTDAALGRELAEKGRARAAQFTWKRCAEETLDVYREVAG